MIRIDPPHQCFKHSPVSPGTESSNPSPSSGESVQTGVRATGGRPRMPLRGRRAASAPRISPGHWDDRRMFPKSEWGMFPKRMLHVPASRRSLRLPDARSRRWNETSLPVRQIIAVAAVKAAGGARCGRHIVSNGSWSCENVKTEPQGIRWLWSSACGDFRREQTLLGM